MIVCFSFVFLYLIISPVCVCMSFCLFYFVLFLPIFGEIKIYMYINSPTLLPFCHLSFNVETLMCNSVLIYCMKLSGWQGGSRRTTAVYGVKHKQLFSNLE